MALSSSERCGSHTSNAGAHGEGEGDDGAVRLSDPALLAHLGACTENQCQTRVVGNIDERQQCSGS